MHNRAAGQRKRGTVGPTRPQAVGPRVTRLPWAGLLVLALLTACTAKPGSPETRLSSHLFKRVEILGSRGTALGQFNKPRSVAVDLENNLYVTDMTGRVQKFSAEGQYLLSWYMPETDRGQPKGLALDAAGNLIVLEPHYARVNHFSTAGQLLEQWGTPGTGPGQFSMPRAVVVNSHGLIYVSEYTRQERIQVFAQDTKQFRFAFGRAGSGPGEFNRPEGLAVDAADRLYVADSCNHRIQVFAPDGNWLASYGGPGTGLGELSYPYDIGIDTQGRQYVCEFGNSRIQIFDTNHQPVEVIGQLGYAPGQFSNPWTLALDAQGNLYVADSGNHRVQKLIRP
jgi:DNA-binding beta-propeller fold protein YncE